MNDRTISDAAIIADLADQVRALSAENKAFRRNLDYIKAEMLDAWEQGIVTIDLKNAIEGVVGGRVLGRRTP